MGLAEADLPHIMEFLNLVYFSDLWKLSDLLYPPPDLLDPLDLLDLINFFVPYTYKS